MSMRDKARSAAAEEGNQIDLTPMLDVVFIMLIFFIVTSSFVKEPGVELFKPQASTQEACERGTIIFAVDANGDIFYNKNKLHWIVHSVQRRRQRKKPRRRILWCR